MVLVSKFFGCSASRQTSTTNSFFGRLRSNVCRNSNSPLQAGSFLGIRGSVKFSAVEAFDGETSCDSPVGKKELSGAWLHSEGHAVALRDFEYLQSPKNIDDITQSRKWLDTEPDRMSHEDNPAYEPRVQGLKRSHVIEMESDIEDDTGSSLDDTISLPGGLWDHSGPPPLVQPAWVCSQDNSTRSRSHFPSRLPPLSSIGGLRFLGSKADSSPVVEVCDLPEPSLP